MTASPETPKATDDEFGLHTDSAWDAAAARDRKRGLADLKKLLKDQDLWKKVAGVSLLVALLGGGAYSFGFLNDTGMVS